MGRSWCHEGGGRAAPCAGLRVPPTMPSDTSLRRDMPLPPVRPAPLSLGWPGLYLSSNLARQEPG